MSQHRYESPNMSQAMEGMSRRKKMIVRIMTVGERFTIRGQEVCMKHIVDAPLCGKFQPIVDRGHHLGDLKGAVVFWGEFRGWLVGSQVASF
jgi:hypothetical protein